MLTSVELFAGAGGLGMGLARAGFRHRAVIERDRWACDTIQRNQARGHALVADWPLWRGDVREFDFASIAGAVDVVAGGPPCQPFSLGGRHKAQDDARDMFPALVEAINLLRPHAFLVENVKGLTRPAFAPYFDYILSRLRRPGLRRREAEPWADHLRRLRQPTRSGLNYHVTFHLVNAADYGVPQQRERVFIIGFRGELASDWSFPRPTHSRAALLADQAPGGDYWDRHRIPARDRRPTRPEIADEVAGRRPWRTVRDALADLPDPEFAPREAHRFADHCFQPGVKFYPGHTGSCLDWPAKTLKAGDHGVPGGENALRRPDGSGRYFTVRETARLQTFPDSYEFAGHWSEAMRQLGNAVPVTLAHTVAHSLAHALSTAALPA